jgi:hypothetical protein
MPVGGIHHNQGCENLKSYKPHFNNKQYINDGTDGCFKEQKLFCSSQDQAPVSIENCV